MTKLFLVRHGETEWNAAGRVQGWKNSDLNGKGLYQAAQLAARLKNAPIIAIYSSASPRAYETAKIVATSHSIDVTVEKRICERGYGEWEGLTSGELDRDYPIEWDQYHRQRHIDVAIPGGETWEQVNDRMLTALHTILDRHNNEDGYIVIIGHGGSLRSLILDALGAPLPVLLNISIDNASLSYVEYNSDKRGRVRFLNDTSHIAGDDEYWTV
jgi:broad specificity phosphatase PhoE